MQLKEKLFELDNTRAICNQKIQEIDDSAIDHIKQYWTGGQTIPENARLAHRYCNWARPRNESKATGIHSKDTPIKIYPTMTVSELAATALRGTPMEAA